MATKAAPTERLEILNINRDPGLGIFDGDKLTGIVSLTTTDARSTQVDIIRAPGKATPTRHERHPSRHAFRRQICLRRGRHRRLPCGHINTTDSTAASS
jgi:hypothetical protein